MKALKILGIVITITGVVIFALKSTFEEKHKLTIETIQKTPYGELIKETSPVPEIFQMIYNLDDNTKTKAMVFNGFEDQESVTVYKIYGDSSAFTINFNMENKKHKLKRDALVKEIYQKRIKDVNGKVTDTSNIAQVTLLNDMGEKIETNKAAIDLLRKTQVYQRILNEKETTSSPSDVLYENNVLSNALHQKYQIVGTYTKNSVTYRLLASDNLDKK